MRAVICAGFKRKPKRNGDLEDSSLIAAISSLEFKECRTDV